MSDCSYPQDRNAHPLTRILHRQDHLVRFDRGALHGHTEGIGIYD